MNYIHSECRLGQCPSIDFVFKSKQTFRETTDNMQQESEMARIALVRRLGRVLQRGGHLSLTPRWMGLEGWKRQSRRVQMAGEARAKAQGRGVCRPGQSWKRWAGPDGSEGPDAEACSSCA